MQHFHEQSGNSIIPLFNSKHTCKPSTKLVKIGSIFWSFYQVVNSVQMLAHFLLFFLGVTIIAPKLHTMMSKHLWSCTWMFGYQTWLEICSHIVNSLFVCLLKRQQYVNVWTTLMNFKGLIKIFRDIVDLYLIFEISSFQT